MSWFLEILLCEYFNENAENTVSTFLFLKKNRWVFSERALLSDENSCSAIHVEASIQTKKKVPWAIPF